MGIRKTLLIASTALVLPLAAHASPLSISLGQGIEPAASSSHTQASDSLYQEANSVKDWWDNIGEGGDNERGDNDRDGKKKHKNDWNNEEGGDRDWNERGNQWSWRDNDDRDGNWWNESGNSGQHNWWNESGDNGNKGKKNKWKHHHDNNEGGEEGGDNGRHNWWNDD